MFWAFNPPHAEEQTQFCSSANFFPLYDVHDSFLNCRNAMMDKNPPAHAFSAAQVLRDMEQSSGDFPPSRIEVHGACVHNLKNVDVDIPLNKLVGIAGISGSGKSSLALGVLYAEGSRRYLEALSTYTRRRLTQASRAQVVDIRHVPAALALHQRPSVPGVRSTFGTMTELLNSLHLLFSRCASHVCEHCGVRNRPTMNVAAKYTSGCGRRGNRTCS